MSTHTLNLSCACGARLRLDTECGETLHKERAAFNTAHESCVPTPGPCEARLCANPGWDASCRLRAGHAGFHESEFGTHWGEQTFTYPVST